MAGQKRTKSERILAAQGVLEQAEGCGCKATVTRNWVSFSPPLPVNLLMQSLDLGDEMAELLKAKEAP